MDYIYPLILVIICVSLTTLTTTLYWRPPHFFKRKLNSPDTVSYQRLVLAMKEVLHPRAVDIPTLLKERADSNQRLVRALNISNTFVSPDPIVHKEFVGQAQYLLNGAKRRGWAHFQAIALEAVQWQLSSHSGDGELSDEDGPIILPFDSFIQNVTLVVVLVGILQVDKPVESFSYHDITIVARNITVLWALSKKQEPIPPIYLEQLTESLRRLVEDEERFPDPANLIVPAWETLWRVVATTVAYSFNNEEIREAFSAFNDCPSDDAFRGGPGGDPSGRVAVKCVVHEAMRLRPPSKRIARLRKRAWCPSFIYNWLEASIIRTKHYADVEKLLHCRDIWGMDAGDFEPSRQSSCHHAHTHTVATIGERERDEALGFVFGYGPLRCIASSWAPMAAAVISGAILKQLRTRRYTLEAGKAVGGRDGWMEWSLRKISDEMNL